MRTLRIKVKPGSRENSLEQSSDQLWIARIKAPPVDGKANQELIRLLSEHFNCPKSAIDILSGASSRIKLVRLNNTSPVA